MEGSDHFMVNKRLLFWLSALIFWGLCRGLLPILKIPLPILPIAWLVILVAGITLLLWLAFEVGKVLKVKWAAVLGLVALGLRVMLSFLPPPKTFFGQISFSAFADTLTLAVALLLGSSISPLIRHANLLPPVAVVLAIVDIWTVLFGGFVFQVYQKAQEGVAVAQKIVEAATVKMPTIASAHYASLSLPVIGIGDLFFSAFLSSLLWRFELNVRASFILSVAFIVIGLLIAQLPFVPLGIPGLPFIVPAILLPNLNQFKYTPEEKKALLVGAIFLVALLSIFSIIASRF